MSKPHSEHHPIPPDTPPSTLRRLLRRYVDPDAPVPSRYRLLMVARILFLLAAAGPPASEVAA